MQNFVLEVKNLTKKFGDFTAVDNISFSLTDGEILGLFGPNGAGKTTTIQMLLGIMQPNAGEIIYFGKPFKKYREEILQDMNFSSSYISFPWLSTVGEILDVFARLYQIPEKKKRVQKLLTIFEIEDLYKKQFYELSEGQKSRLFLVKAFLNYPKILLLDEPTASLDPEIAARVREFLKEEKEKFHVSMLFTSHDMSEVEEMCDRVVFLHRGRIIAEGSPVNLARRITDCKLQLRISEGIEKALNYFTKQNFIFERKKPYFIISLKERDITELLIYLSKNNVDYQEISIKKPNLEDFFLKMASKNYEL